MYLLLWLQQLVSTTASLFPALLRLKTLFCSQRLDRGNPDQTVPRVQGEAAVVVQVGRLQGGRPADRGLYREPGELWPSVHGRGGQPSRSGRGVQQAARGGERQERGRQGGAGEREQHDDAGSAGNGRDDDDDAQHGD